MDALTIFEILKKQNKENILFRYDNLNNFEELRLLSLYLMNKSTNNICESPTKFNFLHEFEKEQSIKAVESGVTNFKLEDVYYDLSLLGYRISNPLEDIKNSIGIFGCSYTFGIGVDYKNTYSTLLQTRLNQPVYNFGIPGGNIQKITKAFCSINNFYKLNTAIFVLPSLYRFEFLREDGKYCYQEDFIPNCPPYNNPNVYKILYEEFDDLTFLNEYIKNLNLIKYNAKINGTKLYIASWCKPTAELNKKFNLNLFNLDPIRFLESEELSRNIKVTDFARDGAHPGVRSHILTADVLYNKLSSNKSTKKII